MEEPLKRRLVGAAVIMSLVIIFVPMLVNEKSSTPEAPEGSAIPIEPEPPPEREIPREPIFVVEPTQYPVLSDEEDAFVTPVEELPINGLPPSTPAASRQAPTRQAPAEPPADGQYWAVQVASFTNPAFAESLVERLREKGFAAFSESVPSGGRTWYRVVVGPENSREQARRLQDAVVRATSDERLRGAIRTYP